MASPILFIVELNILSGHVENLIEVDKLTLSFSHNSSHSGLQMIQSRSYLSLLSILFDLSTLFNFKRNVSLITQVNYLILCS